MSEINAEKITKIVAELCARANYELPADVFDAIISAEKTETFPRAKKILRKIIENCEIARCEKIPICQDTGMIVVFLEIGQDARIVGGNLTEAVNAGIILGQKEGFLRPSVVNDPFERVNTKNNAPGIIHTEIVPGENVKITVFPKGFGSENQSRVKFLKPADGKKGIIDFAVETVTMAGANPCPPVILGIGVGGTFEEATLLAKKALARDLRIPNKNPKHMELEREILEKINQTNIGPMGLGGRSTCLGANIETGPTHIAGLPVAVNVGCWATRKISVETG
jgi:fumarate hydratase subunit alpha